MYKFGHTDFSHFVWIKDGDLFTNGSPPISVEVEMINAGSFSLEVYNSAGHLVSTGQRANPHGGWHTFDFSAGMNPPVGIGQYKLKLVNGAPGVRHVKQGLVEP